MSSLENAKPCISQIKTSKTADTKSTTSYFLGLTFLGILWFKYSTPSISVLSALKLSLLKKSKKVLWSPFWKGKGQTPLYNICFCLPASMVCVFVCLEQALSFCLSVCICLKVNMSLSNSDNLFLQNDRGRILRTKNIVIKETNKIVLTLCCTCSFVLECRCTISWKARGQSSKIKQHH